MQVFFAIICELVGSQERNNLFNKTFFESEIRKWYNECIRKRENGCDTWICTCMSVEY